MNFKNIFILPNVIGERSRRRFGGIFIKIPKATCAWSSLVCMLVPVEPPYHGLCPLQGAGKVAPPGRPDQGTRRRGKPLQSFVNPKRAGY